MVALEEIAPKWGLVMRTARLDAANAGSLEKSCPIMGGNEQSNSKNSRLNARPPAIGKFNAPRPSVVVGGDESFLAPKARLFGSFSLSGSASGE